MSACRRGGRWPRQSAAGEVTSVAARRGGAATIEACDGEVNAFTVVLADGRSTPPGTPTGGHEARTCRCSACRSRSRTTSGWPGTRRPTARSRLADFVPDRRRRPGRPGCAPPGRSSSARPTTRSSATAATPTTTCSGLTRNPWSLDRTPGGSSGGAGASVAYGATPIALGTDGGGSIRIPAAFCGVVGHKPTFGLVPKMPGFRGWPSLSVDGPLTRTVRDAALALSVMAGPSPHDGPADLARPARSLTPPPSPTGRRCGSRSPRTSAGRRSSPSVRAAFRAAVDVLGATAPASWRRHPDAPYPTELWNDVALPGGVRLRGAAARTGGRPMTAGTARSSRPAGRRRAGLPRRAGAATRASRRRWDEFFEDLRRAAHAVDAAAGVRHRRQSGPRPSTGCRSTRSSTTGARSRCPPTSTGCPATAVPTGRVVPTGCPSACR